MFAREGSTVLWWQLYAGGIGCGRYASLEEVHRPHIQGDPIKRAHLGGPRAPFTPPGCAKLWLPPSGVLPKWPFRPGAEPVVDRGRPPRTLARMTIIGKVTCWPAALDDRVLEIAAPPGRSIPRA